MNLISSYNIHIHIHIFVSVSLSLFLFLSTHPLQPCYQAAGTSVSESNIALQLVFGGEDIRVLLAPEPPLDPPDIGIPPPMLPLALPP